MDTPRTVGVDPDSAPLFIKAEEYWDKMFDDFSRNVESGVFNISGMRNIIVSAHSMSVGLREEMAKTYGAEAASRIIYDIARAAGMGDAEDIMREMGIKDPLTALSMGPTRFAQIGWSRVNFFPECHITTDDSCMFVYEHVNSFEADSFLKAGINIKKAVCHMNAGYSSGWIQVVFGLKMAAREIACRAKGDEKCIFVMASPTVLVAKMDEIREKYNIN
jgi:predicted hydrocarbon binding protein